MDRIARKISILNCRKVKASDPTTQVQSRADSQKETKHFVLFHHIVDKIFCDQHQLSAKKELRQSLIADKITTPLHQCTGLGINEAEYIFRRQTRYHHCCVACPCGISEQQLIGRSFHRNHRVAHCCQDLSYLRLGWDGPALCAGSPTEDIIQKINLQYKCQKGWVRFMFC